MLRAIIPLLALGSTALAASNITVTDLSKNIVSPGQGTAQVSAAGSLEPFGKNLGIGCGINWQEELSFGGGLQLGTPTYGLGGGFTANDTALVVGMGLGVTPETGKNVSTNVSLHASKEGVIELVFTSSKPVSCTPDPNAENTIRCVSTGQ